jgi:hypothetical protein
MIRIFLNNVANILSLEKVSTLSLLRETETVHSSPYNKVAIRLPSILTFNSALPLFVIEIFSLELKRIDLLKKECEHTGVTSMLSTSGETIGPPAESE